jgi:hypothetical protein
MRGIRVGTGTGWRLAGLALAAALLAAPVRADVPRPLQGPLGEREVTVLNNSKRAINEIYVSPEAADQWGEDRLGEHMLEAGDSLRLRLGRMRDCIFDAKVIYDDASREENRGVNLCRARQIAFDGSTATAPPETGPEHGVTLLNRTARPIQQLFISPAEANQWGDDRLVAGGISVGDRRSVNWRGGCNVDLRVVFENRAAEERRGVDLCATPALSIEPGWTTADVLPVPPP